jgi:hypothetical protein
MAGRMVLCVSFLPAYDIEESSLPIIRLVGTLRPGHRLLYHSISALPVWRRPDGVLYIRPERGTIIEFTASAGSPWFGHVVV